MRRSPHCRRGGLRGVDYIKSYCDAIQFFLNTFATDEILSETFRRVNQMKQNQNETEIKFANCGVLKRTGYQDRCLRTGGSGENERVYID